MVQGQKVQETVKTLKDDLADLGKMGQEAVGASFGQVKGQVKEGFRNYYSKSQEKITEVGQKVGGALKEYPLRSVLIAMSMGFVVSWLRKRSMS